MIAPASERTLDAGAYLAGALELLAIAAGLAFVAWRLRALLLPGWRGAPARLAESVLAVTALILISELLGSFDAYGEWELIAAVAVCALIVGARGACARTASRDRCRPSPPAPESGSVARVLAVVAVAGVAAAWAVPTLGSLAAGMDRADTLWYHMPLAAKFVQTGTFTELFRFDPIFFASFYPANSEVVHAAPILAFGRDFVSPLLNLGFLAIGLLASWCIGRPYGVAPQALIGGSIALGAEMLVEFQAGEALNDITGVAFVLACGALYCQRVRGIAQRQLARNCRQSAIRRQSRRLRSPGWPPAWQRAPSSPSLPRSDSCSSGSSGSAAASAPRRARSSPSAPSSPAATGTPATP